ncbi:MAG TPA: metalloregulator ArsR/SmtB family transcription factor [bacterium]|nr:metalloregulator ArsR/SmtB family transcription factor [bacterium]HQL60709.1 metalloregulator ArsR/SmtB family transcription factor [bacterium]
MDRRTRKRYEARAEIAKALAHPTRLFLLEELSHGKRCVCELTEMVGADISTVSKHLAILKNAGLVQDEKRGVQVFYELQCPCIPKMFGCLESILAANAERKYESVSG